MHPDTTFSSDAAAALAADWVTIWQSELAALAADPEASETMAAMLEAWFTAHDAFRAHERAQRGNSAAANATARSASAAPASAAGASDADIERRITELERRLDSLSGRGMGRRANSA